MCVCATLVSLCSVFRDCSHRAPEVFVLGGKGTATDDKRADLFSFGIVMWELWTREIPYDRNGDKPQVSCGVRWMQWQH